MSVRTLIHQRTISFGDTDAAGIVYTPRFSHFCMEAAECWFRDVIDYDWYRINTELARGTPVVHMEIDFIGPLIAGDQLSVAVAVEKLGRSTITLGFTGLKGLRKAGSQEPAAQSLKQQCVFTGKIIFCCTANDQGAIPVPEAQRLLIEEYMAQG